MPPGKEGLLPETMEGGARKRCERNPRAKVRPRKGAGKSYHDRRETAGVAIAIAFMLLLVWGFAAAYQAGFQAGVLNG